MLNFVNNGTIERLPLEIFIGVMFGGIISLRLNIGGDETRSGYVQYVPVILPNVPARTMFWYVQ